MNKSEAAIKLQFMVPHNVVLVVFWPGVSSQMVFSLRFRKVSRFDLGAPWFDGVS